MYIRTMVAALLIRLVAVSSNLKNPDHVIVRVVRSWKSVAVHIQEMRAKLFREIRLERLRVVFLANVAFVDRLARMQVRGQHVFPQVFLQQTPLLSALLLFRGM